MFFHVLSDLRSPRGEGDSGSKGRATFQSLRALTLLVEVVETEDTDEADAADLADILEPEVDTVVPLALRDVAVVREGAFWGAAAGADLVLDAAFLAGAPLAAVARCRCCLGGILKEPEAPRPRVCTTTPSPTAVRRNLRIRGAR